MSATDYSTLLHGDPSDVLDLLEQGDTDARGLGMALSNAMRRIRRLETAVRALKAVPSAAPAQNESELSMSTFASLADFHAAQAKHAAPVAHTYASTQATQCAGCGEHKHTPLRIDAMGGYVCLTCIDHKLGSLLGEFGYPALVAWRDHVEQRIRSWRQTTMNRSGDMLAIDDFMGQDDIDALVDYVCDEWAEPKAAPVAPAAPPPRRQTD